MWIYEYVQKKTKPVVYLHMARSVISFLSPLPPLNKYDEYTRTYAYERRYEVSSKRDVMTLLKLLSTG